MTGYGKAEGAVGSRKYTVEVRSLNGKNLDLQVRMPSVLKQKEMDLRTELGARIVRGKSDIAIHFEADGCTFGPPDPFSLLNLGRVGPIKGVKVVGQTVGKRSDAEHPLLQWLANHGVAPAFRLAINDFFVGQCRAQGGAPIHHLLGEVGQALVVHDLPLRGPVEGLPVDPGGKRFRSAYGLPIGRQIAGRQCVFEHVDRSGFAGSRITKAFVRLQPDPLRPPVVIGIDGGHFA